MNAGEPLNEQEAELMMKEADKDGDGTIDYEGTGSIIVPIIQRFQPKGSTYCKLRLCGYFNLLKGPGMD